MLQDSNLFVIDRRPDNDLPPHIQGAARWLEVRNEEGYWVYNLLNSEYLAVEYKEANDQWYFVSQDSQTHRWVAIDTIPSTYNLGRRKKPTSVRAAEVEEEEGMNLAIPANTSDAPFRSTMSTQTLQAQAATSTTMAGDLASTSRLKPLTTFFKQKKSPGSGLPGGGNPGNLPAGGGPLPPLPPPGGGGGAGGGGGGPGGGRNGKLMGNPPTQI